MVPVPHAVVDEYAVVVHPVHASPAHRAVLTPRRLDQAAGPTRLSRPEQREIVRVVRHAAGMARGRHDPRVRARREPEKHVREYDGHAAERAVHACDPRPGAGEKERFAPRE